MLWLARQSDGARPPVRAGTPGDHRVVEAEFTLRMSDILAANIALSRGSRAMMALGVIIFGVGVVILLGGQLLLALPVMIVGLATFFGVASVPFVWLRLRARPELFSVTSSVAADDVGLRYDSPFGSGVYTWGAFRRVRELDGFVFFDRGVGASLFVPVSAFRPDALSRLRRLLIAAGVSSDGHPTGRR
jgi:YcxB-like protein